MKTKLKMKLMVGLASMLAAGAVAQTAMTMTNTLFYTNRWTSVVARVQSAPQTTNAPWVVSFTLVGPVSPGWARSTNNMSVNYNAGSYSSVTVSNSEIATYTGLTVSQVVNSAYFVASSNAMRAALEKLIVNTIGF